MSNVSLKSVAVSSEFSSVTEQAHDCAVEMFGDLVTEIIYSPINGVCTFFIAATGSKVGWDDYNNYWYNINLFEAIQIEENEFLYVYY